MDEVPSSPIIAATTPSINEATANASTSESQLTDDFLQKLAALSVRDVARQICKMDAVPNGPASAPVAPNGIDSELPVEGLQKLAALSFLDVTQQMFSMEPTKNLGKLVDGRVLGDLSLRSFVREILPSGYAMLNLLSAAVGDQTNVVYDIIDPVTGRRLRR